MPSNQLFFQSSLLPFISKKESPEETTFLIDTPPRVGFYKLQIYAVRKPKRPGKVKIPLVATLLIDYRHSIPPAPSPGATASLFKGAALALASLMPMPAPPSAASVAAVRMATAKFSKNLRLVFMRCDRSFAKIAVFRKKK